MLFVSRSGWTSVFWSDFDEICISVACEFRLLFDKAKTWVLPFKMNRSFFNPLNPELNPICYLLALLAQHFLHVSRIMVKSLTISLLMSYIYDISSLRVKTPIKIIFLQNIVPHKLMESHRIHQLRNVYPITRFDKVGDFIICTHYSILTSS